MNDITIERFDDFFRELHGHQPYSWQRRLMDRAVKGDWPGAVDLPTGSGKTACIDIAVFALACQASLPIERRTAPRRVFFCVNRRIIVDEAHQRAQRIARAIWEAERSGAEDRPVLRDVAATLRIVAGTTADNASRNTPPLDVLELRGGIYRDSRWARSVTQPTIICTTIDQLGSCLLFRGYGVSPAAAPIQAALIAYDSLILLDEAHISEPFRQTLDYVQRYLDPQKWAEQRIGVRPVCVVPMTATPSEEMVKRGVIRLDEHDRENQSLNNRLKATKPSELQRVADVVTAAANAVNELAKERTTAVGIIVNRVETAKQVYEQLRQSHHQAIVELVIGSMRPIDRDKQAERLRGLVGPGRPGISEQTSFIVATQCLEVGADYDFDALITECASLDALWQRFGRLNRGGREIDAKAVILVSKKDIKPDEQLDDNNPLDVIYGNAAARTWNWLSEHAQDGTINFGIDAFNALLQRQAAGRIPAGLLAPSASLNAPVILPAFIDFWCQTAPRPVPDPDVSLFLHGPRRGEPDVQVCWRADLGETKDHPKIDQWCDVVALLPPTSAECMSVPISRLRRWLTNQPDHVADHGDLIGVPEDGDSGDYKNHSIIDRGSVLNARGVLWRGAKDSILLRSPDNLRAGDTVVLPVSTGGWEQLGYVPLPGVDGVGDPGDADNTARETEQDESVPKDENRTASKDVAEAAFQAARDRAVLRLHPSLRRRLPAGDVFDKLFDRAADPDDLPTVDEWRNLLSDAVKMLVDDKRDLKATFDRLCSVHLGLIRESYPDERGMVLTTRKRLRAAGDWFLPTLDDGDDEPSRVMRNTPIGLDEHTQHVADAVTAALAPLSIDQFTDTLDLAARLHDLGKADERFQAMLRRTDRTDAWLLSAATSRLLAKSDALPMTRSERDAARRRSGLPKGFRHEMLSVQLSERYDRHSADVAKRDLVLHLIAAHHGYARPFAPVVIDDAPPDIEVNGLQLSGTDRLARPSHRLDSGVAERFWSLTRRYGWWGLAYLEALLRLADQQASAAEDAGLYDDANTTVEATV